MYRFKNNKLYSIIVFSLVLSACQTLPTPNIDVKVEESKMQDTQKIIDSFQFF